MTKKEKIKTISIYVLSAIIIIILFCILHNEISSRNIEPQIITVHDTTIVTQERIKEKEKVKYVTNTDTFFVYQNTIDSLFIKDTVYIQIPIEHKQYTDTFTTDTTKTILDIKYSGYKASLDGIYVQSSFTQKERIKVKHTGFGQFVGIGVHVGYGANINPINKTLQPAPYIGVGITYGWGYHW